MVFAEFTVPVPSLLVRASMVLLAPVTTFVDEPALPIVLLPPRMLTELLALPKVVVPIELVVLILTFLVAPSMTITGAVLSPGEPTCALGDATPKIID